MKQSLVVEDVKLERASKSRSRVASTVHQALEAGLLIGGAEFVINPELGVLAKRDHLTILA
jgi:hypothetical protein